VAPFFKERSSCCQSRDLNLADWCEWASITVRIVGFALQNRLPSHLYTQPSQRAILRRLDNLGFARYSSYKFVAKEECQEYKSSGSRKLGVRLCVYGRGKIPNTPIDWPPIVNQPRLLLFDGQRTPEQWVGRHIRAAHITSLRNAPLCQQGNNLSLSHETLKLGFDTFGKNHTSSSPTSRHRTPAPFVPVRRNGMGWPHA